MLNHWLAIICGAIAFTFLCECIYNRDRDDLHDIAEGYGEGA